MKPKSRESSIVVQEVAGEVLVYDLTADKAFLLNQMSTSVWNLCDGSREISTISQILSTTLNKTVCEDFVLLAIDQLDKNNLLLPMETDSDLKNFNRREVIKKIGLSTAVMLPLVSSLVVPTATQAASTCLFPGGTNPDGTIITISNVNGRQGVRDGIRAACTSCKFRSISFTNCPNENSNPCTGRATCCTTDFSPSSRCV